MGLAPEAAAASQFEVEQMVKADVAAESPPKRAPTSKRPESAPPLAARKIGGGFPAERSRAFPDIVVPDLAAAHERKHALIEQCTNMKRELFRRQTACDHPRRTNTTAPHLAAHCPTVLGCALPQGSHHVCAPRLLRRRHELGRVQEAPGDPQLPAQAQRPARRRRRRGARAGRGRARSG